MGTGDHAGTALIRTRSRLVALLSHKSRGGGAVPVRDTAAGLENDPKPCIHCHRFWTDVRRCRSRRDFPNQHSLKHIRRMRPDGRE